MSSWSLALRAWPLPIDRIEGAQVKCTPELTPLGVIVRSRLFGLQIFALLACLSTLSFADEGVESHDILGAMQLELDRNDKELALPDQPDPYFIAYRVEDHSRHSLGARGGALFDDSFRRTRHAAVEVRVGDYELDSTEDLSGPTFEESMVFQAPVELPIEAGDDALRSVLWLLTDQRYKEALTAWHRVRAQLVYRIEEADRAASFSREKAFKHRGVLRDFAFDADRWREVARKASARVARGASVLESSVRIEARDEVQYLVNTEGRAVRTQSQHYGIHVFAMALSDEGEVLTHGVDRYARGEAHLPDEASLLAQIDTMLEELEALRSAPVMDPYTGPAILLPRASGVLFHEAIGHRLEGHRQDDNEEGRTFSHSVNKSILPAFISIVDDPTIKEYGEVQLNGAYVHDDEGIASVRTQLVDHGKLVGFLMRRSPVKGGFNQSNGHGRAEGVASPVSRMGTLFVEGGEGLTRAELKAQLIREARAQGKPFGLLIDDLVGGNTNTTTYGFQAFKGIARHVVQVDVETGRETLMRGVEIVGTPLTSMNKIMAVGAETGVFNGYCGGESGWVPVSTVAPALLFREIEVQRTSQHRQRGPVLRRPATRQGVSR
jgi:predicted Zn-dependent protease